MADKQVLRYSTGDRWLVALLKVNGINHDEIEVIPKETPNKGFVMFIYTSKAKEARALVDKYREKDISVNLKSYRHAWEDTQDIIMSKRDVEAAV